MSARPRGIAGRFAGPLAEVRYHWGDAYEIWAADGRCRARRRDGKGSELSDPCPAGLRLRIVSDYFADPVPRERAT